MLTSRGWWLLLLALFLAGLGTAWSTARSATLVLVGLALLAWLTVEYLRFHLSLTLGWPRLKVEREVHDERGPVVTLWAGRTFTVNVRVTCDRRWPMPFGVFDDRFPFGVELVSGGVTAAGELRSGQMAEICYRFRCRSAGPVQFEGVRVRFADPQGFFYLESFIRQPLVYPALPPLVDAEAKHRATKRFNMLIPPGLHRMHRPGSGSELLELRDYRPGDPPKMIAWKPSARRDKLITKEFESEVPVRCTLFIDASQSVRLGPPGKNALARLVEIGSATAQAALANRDQVGLVLFDDASSVHVAPARGKRHLIDLLRRLADVGRLPPATTQADFETLLQLAYPFAVEVYPDLMRRDLNAWRWWLPILFPRPEYLRKLTLSDAVLPWWRRLSLRHWRQAAMRKRMAAILSVTQGAAPGGLSALMEDDGLFGQALQRFLADHHVPYPVPMYDWRGKYLFARPEKAEVLADVLLRAVRRGHDNELFVLLVDLYDLHERVEPLRRAVRVALGRHHRVILVCPWPPDMPQPGEVFPGQGNDNAVLRILRRAVVDRYHRAFENVRRDFGRVGVTVVNALQGEPVQLILDRMEQLRVAGIRR
jgi:uncharacterized protein (DUF58 family)